MYSGFDSLLRERYDNYRRGEISFGRLAQDLGITIWELSHLLEERGWPVYNLPTAASHVSQVVLQEAPIDYIVEESRDAADAS
jgi:predicted HTH domain antitoxin